MQGPVQITARGLTLSDEDETRIREHAAKLETFYPQMIGCTVRVSVPNKRPQGAPVHYNVRVTLGVPGAEIVATRQRQKELTAAVQDAFRAIGRQLQDYNRRQRGPTPPREAAPHGVVSRIDALAGFGFLTTADGLELYFHRNSVLNDAFDRLEVGDEVRFTEGRGDEGPQASSVSLAATRRSKVQNTGA